MADFPYDKSSWFGDCFFPWVFQNISFYLKNTPDTENLYEIPKNIEIKKSLRILKNNWKEELKRPKPNFLKAMMKTIYVEYIVACIVMFIGQCQSLVQAIIINYIVNYLENPSAPAYEGALLALAFILSAIVSACSRSNGAYRTLVLTGRVKNMIAMLISEKVLTLNYSSVNEESTRGKILNIISTDMELLELTVFTISLWCIPFLIVFAIITVTFIFGPVAIIGIAISALHIPIVLIVGAMSSKYRKKGNLLGDSRIKMIENLIEGIKIMKLYAWELPLLKNVFKKRSEEMKEKSKIANLNGILQVVSLGGIGLMIFVTFYIQVAIGNPLKPGSVFLVVNVFFGTHVNLVYLTTAGISTVFVFVGIMKRAGEIMMMKDFKQQVEQTNTKYSITLKDATFSWREEEKLEEVTEQITIRRSKSIYKDCLSGISLNVKKGELLMVVGPVGCGKSSLLMGLLGELSISTGDVEVKGSISYACEDAWIIAGSIKDNVLMGRTLDPDLYTQTLNSCALIRDLSMFANGDESLVGDRGFTLSGGQRARLNLARAVYSNCDIILLDDPLSAVDAEVSNHIFQECIKGQLAGKTVILATHQVQFLSQADKILVLANGDNIFYGSYDEMKDREDVQEVLGDYAFRRSETHEHKKPQVKEKKEESNEKQSIEEEEITESSVEFKSYLRYLNFGFRSVFLLILVLLIMCFSQVVNQALYYWAAYWSNQSNQGSNYYIEGMGIILLISYVTFTMRIYFFINPSLNANFVLHNKALKSVTMSPAVFFDKNPTGRIINRFTKDIGVVDGPLQFYLFEAVSMTIIAFGSIIISIMIVPYNAIVLPIWCIVYFILFKYISPLIIHLRKIELVARGPLLSSLNSILNGLPTIRSLGIEKKFKKDLKQHTNHHYRAYLTFHTILRFNQLYVDFSTILVVLLNVVFLVSTKGLISTGLAAYSLQSTSVILGVSTIWSKNMIELGSNMSSAQRLLEYSDLPVEGSLISDDKFQITKGKIKFDNVFMRYRPNLPYSLSGLSFTINPGEKIGIIGRTGAGKSSVLQVLFRLVNPESGTIYLDGYDYMQMGLHELRGQMSVIPQSPVIFSGSIRENLDPFYNHDDSEILNVLEDVQLKNTVLEHDDKLNSDIGGDGISLSSGQKQLLCLARSILRKNKIIMMDEATANVDNETDKFIQDTIKNKFDQCTLLVIAHRIRTIIGSDKIIVIDNGICKEFGRPHDLFKDAESLFRNMIFHTGPEESQFLIDQIMEVNNKI